MLLFFIDTIKALFCHFFVFFDHCLGDDEILYPVLTRIREVLGTYHAVLLHCVTHAEGWVDEDAVVATQHLSVHAPHRSADDEVGLFLLAELPEERHCLFGTDGEIGSDDVGIGQHLADASNSARLS